MKSSCTNTQDTQAALLAYITTISAVFTLSLNEPIRKYLGFDVYNEPDLLLVALLFLGLLCIGFTLTVSTIKPREESQREKEQRFRGALLPLELFLSSAIGSLCVGIAYIAKTTSSTNWFLILINEGNTFLANLITKNPALSFFLFTLIFGSFLFDWHKYWINLIIKIKKIFTKN